MENNVYVYILIMGGVTYLVRALPLTLIRKQIHNRYIRSFLYYVPYVTLAAMTFPAILKSTAYTVSAVAGFLVCIGFAFFRRNLITVALAGSAAVFVVETILQAMG